METLEKIYIFAKDKKRGDGIILDTGVLILFFVGKYNVSWIKDLKLTNTYTEEDFHLVEKIVKPFRKIIITPHVLAELSNHFKNSKIENAKLHQYFCLLADYLRNKEKTQENHLEFCSWKDQTIPRLCMFGFVDMGMYELSKIQRLPLLTDDLDFHAYAKSKREIPIIKLSIVKYSNIAFKSE
jgi:hypothetical protein